MPKYKVLKPGFFGGIFRTPGGKHDPVVTAKPIPKTKMGTWLEEVVPPKPLTKAEQKKAAAAEDKTNENENDFMGDDPGVETL